MLGEKQPRIARPVTSRNNTRTAEELTAVTVEAWGPKELKSKKKKRIKKIKKKTVKSRKVKVRSRSIGAHATKNGDTEDGKTEADLCDTTSDDGRQDILEHTCYLMLILFWDSTSQQLEDNHC